MTKSDEYTTLKEELKKLKPSETLVTLWKEGMGYYLFIGNDPINHLWAVTEAELLSLKKLLNRKFHD